MKPLNNGVQAQIRTPSLGTRLLIRLFIGFEVPLEKDIYIQHANTVSTSSFQF